ncbi:MAG: flavin reductase, partial [Anaerolineae bacterium]|nr:flavin reductase [Anaerolineae bacterium]NIQ82951.1 flavin reductase [Anaerolineae bacterium]
CAATFDCRVEAVHDQGDEKLIVGHIVAAERLKETYEPLIYREEDY